METALTALALCILQAGATDASPFLNADDLRFLREMTAAVVEASRVAPGSHVGKHGPNKTGGTLIRPGGRECYPAFWIRDYAMSIDAGLFSQDEQRHALMLTVGAQQEKEWALPSGSRVPAGAIPDHITFGGKPIFYPGTLDDYEGQGGAQWGILPSLDDHFYLIHMAAEYVRATGPGILKMSSNGMSVMQRLERAFVVPPARPDTGLVYSDEKTRGVNFGFFDTVTHTGDLLFCSLLRYDAAREMARLYKLLGQDDRIRQYQLIAANIRRSIAEFAMPDGWLKAATGVGGQPDVWGTAYAVYCGALTDPLQTVARTALAKAVKEGTIACRGNIRHVPTTSDFSEKSAWEKALAPKNTYQNGAYWGTPAGWVCYAVARVDRATAQALARDYIQELRDGDFRNSPDNGSPWECFHPDNNHRQNPVYMASVTCPLAAFERLMREEAAEKEQK